MVVIADDDQVEAIGGIMGGELSGVYAGHHQRVPGSGAVRSRSAPRAPAASSASIPTRAIASSAASIPKSADWGVEVGATADPRAVRRRGEPRRPAPASMPEWHRSIALPPGSRARRSAASRCQPSGRREILVRARLRRRGDRAASIGRSTPPSWRADVEGEADLVEEVIRINDYDNIPVVLAAEARPLCRSPRSRRSSAACRSPSACWRRAGCWRPSPSASCRARSPSCSRQGSNAPLVMLANPISADLDAMRPSILRQPAAWRRRATRRAASPTSDLFEVGPHYLDETREGPGAERRPACASACHAAPLGGQAAHRRCLRRQGRCAGAAADASARRSTICRSCADAPGYYHPGRSAVAAPRAHRPGAVRRAASRRAEGLRRQGSGGRLRGLPRPPAACRDRKGAGAAAAERLAVPAAGARLRLPGGCDRAGRQADPRRQERRQGADHRRPRCSTCSRAAALPEGKKSIAFSVTIQPRERTLTDQEIEALSAKIVAAVNKATGGELRK